MFLSDLQAPDFECINHIVRLKTLCPCSLIIIIIIIIITYIHNALSDALSKYYYYYHYNYYYYYYYQRICHSADTLNPKEKNVLL